MHGTRQFSQDFRPPTILPNGSSYQIKSNLVDACAMPSDPD
jgi:hypothetical protein